MIWTAALTFAFATLFAFLMVIATQAAIVPRAIRRLLTRVRPRQMADDTLQNEGGQIDCRIGFPGGVGWLKLGRSSAPNNWFDTSDS